MKERTWPYGTRLEGKVVEVLSKGETYMPHVTIVQTSPEEAHAIVNVNHAIIPKIDMQIIMEFKQGGPTGGYWQIISEKPAAG